jgi:hypothetical protein
MRYRFLGCFQSFDNGVLLSRLWNWKNQATKRRPVDSVQAAA